MEKKKTKKQKSEEATGDLIGNEITDNITRALKTSPQNSSQKIESKTEMTVCYYHMLCHVQVSGWIYTLKFAWMSRNSLLQAGAISEV